MKPIKTEECNCTFTSSDKLIADLPILRQDGIHYSFWQPTEKEIALLKRGGHIVLAFKGDMQPPIKLTVE